MTVAELIAALQQAIADGLPADTRVHRWKGEGEDYHYEVQRVELKESCDDDGDPCDALVLD